MGKKQGQDTPITLPPLYRQERVWEYTLLPIIRGMMSLIVYTSGTEHVRIGYLSLLIHNSLETKLKLPQREGGTKGEREGKKERGGKEGRHLYILDLKPSYSSRRNCIN